VQTKDVQHIVAKITVLLMELVTALIDEKLKNRVSETELDVVAARLAETLTTEQAARIAVELDVAELNKATGTITRHHEERIKKLEEEVLKPATEGSALHLVAQMVAEIMTTTTKPTVQPPDPPQQPPRSPQQGIDKGGPRVRSTAVQYLPHEESITTTWNMLVNGVWTTAAQLASRNHKKNSRPWDYWRRAHSRNMRELWQHGKLERQTGTGNHGELKYRKPTTQTNTTP